MSTNGILDFKDKMYEYHLYVESKKKKRYRCTYLQRRNGDSDVENGCMDTGGM